MKQEFDCLPDGITLSMLVEVVQDPKTSNSSAITVEEKLNSLGARCRNGKLVDRLGRAIRFIELQGRWGNPPQNYLEILKNESRQLAELERDYTVIRIANDPVGILPSTL